jgi:DNA repair protein SbcD/Mre11
MDALGELQGMMETAASDFDLQAQLASDTGDLVRKLPHDIRAHSEDAALRAAIDGNIAGLITHAGAYLSARLGAEKV